MIKHAYLPVCLALYLILGSWKGYVALFRPGEEEPWQFFSTPVASLPEADQEKLAEGIVIRSEGKLQQVLEDFLS